MRRTWLMTLALVAAMSCDKPKEDSLPPSAHPYFPSALLQNEDTLYVLSSNFDQRYAYGSILSVDLKLVDPVIAASKDSNTVVGKEAVTSSAFIPSLSDGPVLSAKKDSIFFVSRRDITLRSVPIAKVNGLLSCESGGSALGQDCYSSEASATLSQSNPYFLTAIPSLNSATESMVVGYLLQAGNYIADGSGSFLQPQYFELERFTWNSSSRKAKIEERFAIGDVFRAMNDPSASSQAIRTNLFLGAVVSPPPGDLLYMLTESPPAGTLGRRSVNLLRISAADLQDSSKPVKIARFDISAASSMDSLGLLEIARGTEKLEIFVSNSYPGFIAKFELPLRDGVDEKEVLKMKPIGLPKWVCDAVADMKLTPNNRTLVVACSDGTIRAYDTRSLIPSSADPAAGPVFGRGPVKLHFDSRRTLPPFRFYSANFRDGSISIFDLLESPESTEILLVRKGHIFAPSSPKNEGGTEK